MNTSVALLRKIGFLEGVSFLLLLGGAMPLKYLAGMPMAVKVVGWAHGVLFVAYVLALVHAARENGWSLSRMALGFVASLLPFGPFVIDSKFAAWSAPSTPAAAPTTER